MIKKIGPYRLLSDTVTRRLFICFAAISSILISFVVHNEVYGVENISEFEWQKRIILILSERSTDDDIALLQHADDEIRDRHIYWFVLQGKRVISNYPGQLDQKFVLETKKYFRNDGNNVLLIGKDGGIKNRSSSLELGTLFALIDTMPMRQAEIGDRNAN
ncbi:MAG: DUF4174 domain-containing protein [Desulfobacterales bacterium]|nr:DUF4174 domain-containing protein [Deltaproteobacteria bacterium]NNK94913.1 DUF4174 domain-containing protein [Desulfobacterales bacterium]